MERCIAGGVADVRELVLERSAGGPYVEGGDVATHCDVQDEIDEDLKAEAAGDECQIDCPVKALLRTAVDPAAGAENVADYGDETTESGACLKALNSRQATPSAPKSLRMSRVYGSVCVGWMRAA